MVNKEILMILAMTAGGLFGSLGGTIWKPLRRFFLPVILGVLALLSGFVWWKCLIFTILMVGSFCLPYGEKYPYWFKFLVGCSFSAPSILFGLTIWQIIVPITWIVLFILSNTKILQDEFVWKVVEFMCFSSIGINLAVLISKYGRII